MKKNPFNKNGLMFRSFILIAVCFAVSVAMYFLDAFSYFENKTYDIRMRAASKYVHASDDIVFIGVDQKSLDWAKENRSALIRIPASKNEKRIELRSPDPKANPYLAFTLLIHAAIEGIRENLVPSESIEENLFSQSAASRKTLESIPGSFEEAKKIAANSDFVKEVLGESLLNAYLN